MAENKRELVKAVFDHKKPERVPVGFWFHYAAAREEQDGFADPTIIEQNRSGHKKFFDGFHPDLVKLMSDGYFKYPNDAINLAKTAADFRNAKPLPKDHPWFEAQVKLVKEVTDYYKHEVYTFYNLFSPASLLKFYWGGKAFNLADGNKNFADLVAQDKEAVRYALNLIADDVIVLLTRVIKEGGADGIYLSVQNIQDIRISPAIYQDLIAPVEHKILNAAAALSKTNILHICGYEGAKNNLSIYKDYPVAAINWAAKVEGFSISQARALFGDRVLIGGFGNTKNDILYKGTKEEVQAETKRLLEEGGREGLILGADCTVPYDIDWARFDWVREVAK